MLKTKRGLKGIAGISLLGAITPSLTSAIDGHDIFRVTLQKNMTELLNKINSVSSEAFSFLKRELNLLSDVVFSNTNNIFDFECIQERELTAIEEVLALSIVVSVRPYSTVRSMIDTIDECKKVSVDLTILYLGLVVYTAAWILLIYLLFLSGIVDRRVDRRLDFLDKIRAYRVRVKEHLVSCKDHIRTLIHDFPGKNEDDVEYLGKVCNLALDFFESTNVDFSALKVEIDALRDEIVDEPFYKSLLRSNKKKKFIVEDFNQIVRDAHKPCLQKLKKLSEYLPQLNSSINNFESTLNNVEG